MKDAPTRPIEDLRKDPLQGACGLAWYQREPGSLSQEEWKKLDLAVGRGEVLLCDYMKWMDRAKQ